MCPCTLRGKRGACHALQKNQISIAVFECRLLKPSCINFFLISYTSIFQLTLDVSVGIEILAAKPTISHSSTALTVGQASKTIAWKLDLLWSSINAALLPQTSQTSFLVGQCYFFLREPEDREKLIRNCGSQETSSRNIAQLPVWALSRGWKLEAAKDTTWTQISPA